MSGDEVIAIIQQCARDIGYVPSLLELLKITLSADMRSGQTLFSTEKPWPKAAWNFKEPTDWIWQPVYRLGRRSAHIFEIILFAISEPRVRASGK